jgi:hypothetical protein
MTFSFINPLMIPCYVFIFLPFSPECGGKEGDMEEEGERKERPFPTVTRWSYIN